MTSLFPLSHNAVSLSEEEFDAEIQNLIDNANATRAAREASRRSERRLIKLSLAGFMGAFSLAADTNFPEAEDTRILQRIFSEAATTTLSDSYADALDAVRVMYKTRDLETLRVGAGQDAVIASTYEHAPAVMANVYMSLGYDVLWNCPGADINLCPEDMQRDAMALFRSFVLDKAYVTWDTQRNSAYEEAIAHDPMLIEAREVWHDKAFDEDARKAALQRALEIHAAAYSDNSFVIEPARMTLGGIDEYDVGANYNHITHDVTFRADDVMNLGFEATMEMLTHEARHHVENRLVAGMDDFYTAAYLQEQGIMPMAVMLFVSNRLIPVAYSAHGDGYRLNPVEVNARMMESSGKYAGKAGPQFN